jgi:hypothetical protein
MASWHRMNKNRDNKIQLSIKLSACSKWSQFVNGTISYAFFFFVKGIIITPGFALIDAHNHFIVEFDCSTFTNNGSQRAATKTDQRKIKKNSDYPYASLLLYMSSATLVIDSTCNHLQRAAFDAHRIPLLL